MAYQDSFGLDDSYDEEEALQLVLALSLETVNDPISSDDYESPAGPSDSQATEMSEDSMLELALEMSKHDFQETEQLHTANLKFSESNRETEVSPDKCDFESFNEEDDQVHSTSSPLSLKDMETPQPFIITKSNGCLGINSAVLEYIQSITSPLVIVSVAGIYRTGKSYLLNRLAGKQVGFPLGSTVQSETKGIWIWIIPHPMDSSQMLVLLDTEGLADPEKGDATHDAKIFCLALLLSSTFVYNSKGTIDNNALQDLQMTTELSSHIRLKAKSSQEEEDENLESIFPKFVWAVRDFFLKCEVKGVTVSPNEYLEWSLELKKGHGNKASQANSVRKSIKESFRERHCFLFPFPTTPERLQELEKLKFEELDDKFVNISEEFTKTVLDISTIKTVVGKDVTGRMFINLAKCYVEAINKGGVPVIENAVDYITKVENEKAKEKALLSFKSWKDKLHLPISLEELTRKISNIQKEAIKTFAAHCIFDDKQIYSAQLAEELRKCSLQLLDENLQSSKTNCENIIKESFKNISENIQNGIYLHSRGYEQYQEDYFEALESYEACSVGQQAKHQVLQEFMKSSEGDRMQIINADNKIHEEEKKILKLRIQNQEEEARKEQALSDMEELKQRSIEAEQNYKEGLELYKQEMQQRANVEKKELRKKMEHAQKENERLIRQGFAEEAAKAKSQLQQLERQLQQKDSESSRRYAQLQKQLEKEMKESSSRHQREMNRLAAIANRPQVVHRGGRGGCSIS